MSVDLGLAISANSPEGQEFHIVLILLVMIFTIIFCHSLARVIMLVMQVGKDDHVSNVKPSMNTLDYAQTDRPIPVVLACDEEMAAENNGVINKVIPPPPAYGRWRSSVVCTLACRLHGAPSPILALLTTFILIIEN